MKKHIISIIVLMVVSVVMVTVLYPNRDIAEPSPLVIETPIDTPEPGTVTIITPYQDSESWTGLIYVDQDGNITVMDAVERE